MTALLSLLLIVPPLVLAVSLARRARGGVLSQRALAVAAVGGRDLGDVVTYTQDCSMVACMLLTRRGSADPELVRRVLRDAVTQVDSVQRAARLLGALGARPGARRGLGTWPDFLLSMAGVFDAGVMATLITWRGESGITDLQGMTERAIARFRATVDGGDKAPLVTLFAEELVRLGLLDDEQLEGADGDSLEDEDSDRDRVRH